MGNRKTNPWKVPIILAGSLVGLVGLSSLDKVFNPQQGQQTEERQEAKETPEQRLSNTVINYSSDPDFTTDNLLEQVTGFPIKVRKFDLNQNRVYLSIPSSAYREDLSQKLVTNPGTIRFAKNHNGKFDEGILELDDWQFRAKQGEYVFSIAPDTLKLDPSRNVTKKLGRMNYAISLEELADALDHKYGNQTPAIFTIGKDKKGKTVVMGNHGRYLANNQPSIEKIVNQIIYQEQTHLRKAQRLLDFVNKDITYDEATSENKAEILQRPHETLLHGKADCSGKAILYTSMLQHAKIPAILVYFPSHIATGVETSSGGNFTFRGKEYLFAHSSVIGGAPLGYTPAKYNVENMIAIQDTNGSNPIDTKTGKPLNWR